MDGRDRVVGNAGGMGEVWLESFLTFCVTSWVLHVDVLAVFFRRGAVVPWCVAGRESRSGCEFGVTMLESILS